MSTPKKEVNFTARDFELLAKAMSCTKEAFAIDYTKFADAGEFKNPNSAKASWHSLKKKLDALADGAPMKGAAVEGEDGGIPATPAKTPSKKRNSDAVKDEGEDEDGGGAASGSEAAATPVVKATPAKKRKSNAGIKTEEGSEEGEAEPTTPAAKKTPAKKAPAKRGRKAKVEPDADAVEAAAAKDGDDDNNANADVKVEASDDQNGEQVEAVEDNGEEATAGATKEESVEA